MRCNLRAMVFILGLLSILALLRVFGHEPKATAQIFTPKGPVATQPATLPATQPTTQPLLPPGQKIIPLDELPTKVLAKVHRLYPRAHITRAVSMKYDGKTLYKVSLISRDDERIRLYMEYNGKLVRRVYLEADEEN
jgi:hypothetical protein